MKMKAKPINGKVCPILFDGSVIMLIKHFLQAKFPLQGCK